jgi:hypothetical protein
MTTILCCLKSLTLSPATRETGFLDVCELAGGTLAKSTTAAIANFISAKPFVFGRLCPVFIQDSVFG